MREEGGGACMVRRGKKEKRRTPLRSVFGRKGACQQRGKNVIWQGRYPILQLYYVSPGIPTEEGKRGEERGVGAIFLQPIISNCAIEANLLRGFSE